MPASAVVHIIDDDEAVRQSLAFLLSTAGIRGQALRVARRPSWPALPRPAGLAV